MGTEHIDETVLGDSIPDEILYERVQGFLEDHDDPELSNVIDTFPELNRDECEIFFGDYIWEHKLVSDSGGINSEWGKGDVESFLKAHDTASS